jgi:hypothetical protein
MSKFLRIWHPVALPLGPLVQVTVTSLSQPSSRPLPLQPAHMVRWVTPFESEAMSMPPTPDWCMSQSSLFFCITTTCFWVWPFAF